MELIVVVIIIGIIASRVLYSVQDYQLDATASNVLRNVSTIHNAADLFRAANSRLPDDGLRGRVPQEFEGLVDVGIFKTLLPNEALYDWNGPGTSLSYGMSVVYPRGQSAVTKPLYDKLEELADDSSPNDGWIRASHERILFLID